MIGRSVNVWDACAYDIISYESLRTIQTLKWPLSSEPAQFALVWSKSQKKRNHGLRACKNNKSGTETIRRENKRNEWKADQNINDGKWELKCKYSCLHQMYFHRPNTDRTNKNLSHFFLKGHMFPLSRMFSLQVDYQNNKNENRHLCLWNTAKNIVPAINTTG